MLRVTEIRLVAKVLDLSASGGGRLDVTAVACGDVQLCNALELIELQSRGVQVEVCESCGHNQCASGGWVTLRRCGPEVVWVPLWDVMEQGDWEVGEYRPPTYLGQHGGLVFAAAAWEELQRRCPALPPASSLRSLTSREAVRLIQAAAPLRVLGSFPEPPRLRRDLLLGVVEGDPSSESDVVDRILGSYFESVASVRLESAAAFHPIEFLLDSWEEPTWIGFGRRDGQVSLLVDEAQALVSDVG